MSICNSSYFHFFFEARTLVSWSLLTILLYILSVNEKLPSLSFDILENIDFDKNSLDLVMPKCMSDIEYLNITMHLDCSYHPSAIKLAVS